MKNFYIIPLLLLSVFYNAQEQFSSMLTVDPISFIVNGVSLAPRLNVGYVHKVDKRLWAGVEVGYGNKVFAFDQRRKNIFSNEEYQAFEVRPEIYYDLRPNKKLKHLLSAEFVYLNHKNRYQNRSFKDLETGKRYEFDWADYSRKKYGLNLNYNLFYYLGENFAIMQKVGVGFRTRNIEYTNVINPHINSDNRHFNIIATGMHNEGVKTGFNFNLAFKLVYKFK